MTAVNGHMAELTCPARNASEHLALDHQRAPQTNIHFDVDEVVLLGARAPQQLRKSTTVAFIIGKNRGLEGGSEQGTNVLPRPSRNNPAPLNPSVGRDWPGDGHADTEHGLRRKIEANIGVEGRRPSGRHRTGRFVISAKFDVGRVQDGVRHVGDNDANAGKPQMEPYTRADAGIKGED